VLVGLSLGGRHALQLAAWYPERAAGVVAIGTALPWPVPPGFDEPKDSHQGWDKANRHYWLADYRGWVEFFMSQVFTEPHSTKQYEDGVAWGVETTAETLLLTVPALGDTTEEDAEAICRQVRCPVLIVHGDQDGIVPYETGVALAHWTGGPMVTIRGGGHAPTLRDPVQVNLLIRGFAESLGSSAPAS
jgi:pimeloyl-ACP methyl ester carboxylesterase